MKNLKLYIIVLLFIMFAWVLGSAYINYLNIERDRIIFNNYKNQAQNLKNSVSSMILSKQKSTVAIALSISSDEHLSINIKNNKIDKDYFKELIQSYKDNTLYQNIWIQVIDKNLISLYRSWSPKMGDDLSSIRGDLKYVKEHKKPIYSISVGRFDLSLKAIVPIMADGEFTGILEVISHFNSIDKQLLQAKVSSLVVLDKSYKKQLYYPFTNIFIDDYYIANLDAREEDMVYLKEHGVERYFQDKYFVQDDYLIVSYPLLNKQNKILGYFIMFQNLKDINSIDVDYFMFKWISIAAIAVVSLMFFISFLFFNINRKQKYYYKNILNSLTNIVVITDKKIILDVNSIFFKYIYSYDNLKKFKNDYNCVCELFAKGKGYLQEDMDGINWVDYLINNQDNINKAKIKYENNEYYFTVSASVIDEVKQHYSVVFTDITKEELYKIELEHISITDPLTNIKNRRYFQEQMRYEISRSKRYKTPLSFIMFDIDFFKKINDENGHDVGDEVLITYTSFVSSKLRDSDIFCRIGGEEFMIIVPDTNKTNAYKMAQKLREDIKQYQKILPITMSFGVVEYIKDEDSKKMLKRLDNALYEAKENGRNMVVVG